MRNGSVLRNRNNVMRNTTWMLTPPTRAYTVNRYCRECRESWTVNYGELYYNSKCPAGTPKDQKMWLRPIHWRRCTYCSEPVSGASAFQSHNTQPRYCLCAVSRLSEVIALRRAARNRPGSYVSHFETIMLTHATRGNDKHCLLHLEVTAPLRATRGTVCTASCIFEYV